MRPDTLAATSTIGLALALLATVGLLWLMLFASYQPSDRVVRGTVAGLVTVLIVWLVLN